MTFTPASTASLIAFLCIVVGVIAAIIAGVYIACRRAGDSPTRPMMLLLSLLATWLGIFTAIVATGAMEAWSMPLLPIVMIASLIIALAFGFSPFGRRLATLPLWMLIAFQVFRLPLELVLHEWSLGRTIPETMTWTGRNFDIVTGVVVLIAATLTISARPAMRRLRHVIAWSANIVGLALLLNVIYVAVMSSPLPFAWQIDPPLQLVLHIPYAWIVPVCVGGALAGHVVLTRALLWPDARETGWDAKVNYTRGGWAGNGIQTPFTPPGGNELTGIMAAGCNPRQVSDQGNVGHDFTC